MSPRRKAPPPPRAHWLSLCFALLALCSLLTLDLLVSGQLDSSEHPPSGSRQYVPETAVAGGGVIDAREPAVRHLPPKTLALSFLDGPDPQWTPAVLDVLARHHVRATFFVTGAQAAHNPGLIRQIMAAGHEIGDRTMTGADLRHASERRVQLELQATDLTLAAAAGITSNLVQPPYMATGASLDYEMWKAILRIGNSGRQVVVADVDSEDSKQPDAGAVLAKSTPQGDRGSALLMRDSAGPQTVEALDRMLPGLQRSGWKVDSVSGAFGLSGATNQAGILYMVSGWLLICAVKASGWFESTVRFLLFAATALAALRTLLVLIVAPFHVRRARRWRPPWHISQRVGVIVPAYNEEAGVEATVRSLLASRHPVEVIVVDDGSTDGTAGVVERLARRYRRVRLVRQENSGKAAALNTGLEAAQSELVVMIDGDTIVEPDAVGRLVAHFTDASIGAVAGNAKVGNRNGMLGRWQHVEYVMGFNLDRRMYDTLQCMPTVPGAIGAFRRSAVQAVGGVSEDTLAEDTDLTMALERDGWRVVYEERAVAWTEAPATLSQLWKQRYRWCYGTLQATWKHRGAVLERGAAGRLGRRGLPYLVLFQVVLQVLCPIVDVAGVFALFTADPLTLIATWVGFQLLAIVPGVIAFKLEGERLTPLFSLPLQQIVYRQMMYLVVIQSVATALAGARLPWHKLERRGQLMPAQHAGGESFKKVGAGR